MEKDNKDNEVKSQIDSLIDNEFENDKSGFLKIIKSYIGTRTLSDLRICWISDSSPDSGLGLGTQDSDLDLVDSIYLCLRLGLTDFGTQKLHVLSVCVRVSDTKNRVFQIQVQVWDTKSLVSRGRVASQDSSPRSDTGSDKFSSPDVCIK